MSVVLLAGVAVVAVVAAAGLGRAAGATRQVARVQAVADLVAGAAVVADTDGARRVAAANGATLAGVRSSGDVVTVAVTAGGVSRSATARPADPTASPGAP